MLALKNRIILPVSIDVIHKETLQKGLQEIPLKGEISILAAHLTNFHADPADRFIVATAIHLKATLLTVDQKILEWSGELSRFPANH
jgi:PIN domain nuclease of toxin-antitoxin system